MAGTNGFLRFYVRDNVQWDGHCCERNPFRAMRDSSALKEFLSQHWPASCKLSRLLHGYLLKKSIIWHKNGPPESDIRAAPKQVEIEFLLGTIFSCGCGVLYCLSQQDMRDWLQCPGSLKENVSQCTSVAHWCVFVWATMELCGTEE